MNASPGPVLLALLLLSAAPAVRAGEPPVCRVSVSLEPELAWVDQQVLYRLRVESRADVRDVEWLVPPAFPGLRWERLPGRPDAAGLNRDGVEYRVREEHRAIFPERPGRIALPEASLRCSAAWQVLDVLVSDVELRARELPAEGRPPGFAGLVGAVGVERRLHPSGGPVGKSLRLSVRLSGAGNLWDAPDPLPAAPALGRVEIFRLDPEQEIQRGERLFASRLFRYDLVPREAGFFRVPELRVPYFDPETGAYAVAVVPELDVDVAPRGAAAADAAALEDPTAAPSAPAPGRAEPAEGPPWAVLAAVSLLAGVAAILWLRRRGQAPRAGLQSALSEARRAIGADDAAAGAAFARVLRNALSRHLAGAERMMPEEMLASPELADPVRHAALLLAASERARFDPTASAPDPLEIERAVAALSSGRG